MADLIRCTTCKVEKDPAEFYNDANKKNGKRSSCKICANKHNAKWQRANPGKRRDAVLKHKYGLAPNDYKDMLAKQNGCCAICKTDNPGSFNNKYFHVDHCHTTGKVRSLLCNTCNLGIGHLNDNPALLRTAALYLEQHA